jgi:hypothetical protein
MLHKSVFRGKGHGVHRAGLSAADVALRPRGSGRPLDDTAGLWQKLQRVSVVCSCRRGRRKGR